MALTTPRDLRRRVEDVNDALEAQYGRGPFCEYLHWDFGFPETPLPEEQRARIRENLDIPDDSIKLTIEHEEVHTVLRRIITDAHVLGLDTAQLVAQMLVVGRRIGLAEAAGLLGEPNNWRDLPSNDKMFGGSE